MMMVEKETMPEILLCEHNCNNYSTTWLLSMDDDDDVQYNNYALTRREEIDGRLSQTQPPFIHSSTIDPTNERRLAKGNLPQLPQPGNYERLNLRQQHSISHFYPHSSASIRPPPSSYIQVLQSKGSLYMFYHYHYSHFFVGYSYSNPHLAQFRLESRSKSI